MFNEWLRPRLADRRTERFPKKTSSKVSPIIIREYARIGGSGGEEVSLFNERLRIWLTNAQNGALRN